MRLPSKMTLPATGLMRPETVFMSVDLPAPFGPSSATISPLRTLSPACQST